MMEENGAPADVLLQLPWLPVNISDCQLLTKMCLGDLSYHILLTDLGCVWEERMDSAAILTRSQELNKRLRAPVEAFFSHLCEVVQPCLRGDGERGTGRAQISLTRQGNGNLNMRLKSELAGLPFYWEFHCTPAPVPLVCSQLLRPLMAMSHLLQRQVEDMGDLLARKDAEIQDYRENGATLSRERLQTDVFEEQTYRESFMANALPLICSKEQETLCFSGHLQHLYASMVAHGNSCAEMRKLSKDVSITEDQLTVEGHDLTPSLGGTTVSGGSAEVDQRHHNKRNGETGAKIADGSTDQQSCPVRSDQPSDRTSSKPKKKKVGLFR